VGPTSGASVKPGKIKRKGLSSILGPKLLGQLKAQPSSAWIHGSARPAAQQAGSILGLARRVGRRLNRLAHGPPLSPLSLRQNGPRGQRPTLPPIGGALLSVSHRIWCGCHIRCGSGPGWSRVCVSAGVCVASAPGVLEGMPEGAWPRCECDIAAALRGHRAR
jgi:hypothetical protein